MDLRNKSKKRIGGTDRKNGSKNGSVMNLRRIESRGE
ncbi:unnamed protein product [Anisakis simplex]|uniref:Uncharacterized protein n=1 Tax=Anisakis simplex TaxID=6269 RepID=A0A0M3KKQ4_ANISI|nr:unnamed protein product [Anisakis simplex]